MGPPVAADPDPGVLAWLLGAAERGNAATALPAWTEGDEVTVLAHGSEYFAALVEAVRDTGPGDAVWLVGWRGDQDERLGAHGPTVGGLLEEAVGRGVELRGLVWRSHLEALRDGPGNMALAERLNRAGAQVLLDQRVRPLGSHHQKFVVVHRAGSPENSVAFVGGIDLGHGRRDDASHEGDPQARDFPDAYGDRPAWHDVQVRLRGPAVAAVSETFRERWEDPHPLSMLPWHVLSDVLRQRLDRRPRRLSARRDPPPAGTCAVQLLRTYPRRFPRLPFAPEGERSVARGYGKALRRARRLVYLEDQYVWSRETAEVFSEALRRTPGLRLVVVVPRHPDHSGAVAAAATVGHIRAVQMLLEAGGDRVCVVDPENHAGTPVYVHAKVCVVDDVWATVGSDNINRRSWTHDSELTAAVVDTERDRRRPLDPGGLGDGARVFARELRLSLLREHLDLTDDEPLLDPDDAFDTVVASAERLQAWYDGGCQGTRPPGRLRPHRVPTLGPGARAVAQLGYAFVSDPDGRPLRMRRSRRF